MIIMLIGLIVGLFFGVLGVICLRGVDWILINGQNMMSKEDKQKFKAKHDMIAMNRFIGKRVLLPIAAFFIAGVLFAFIHLQFEPVWMQSSWIAVPILAAVVYVLYVTFSALPKVLGSHFEIQGK